MSLYRLATDSVNAHGTVCRVEILDPPMLLEQAQAYAKQMNAVGNSGTPEWYPREVPDGQVMSESD